MIPTWARILAGVVIFAILGTVDLVRNGRRATRWREYCFLLACVAIAIAYGIINDQITSRISWEYFYYGKDLAPVLGRQTPPDPTALIWQAARIGAAATWWAGLLAGAAMLLANNPSPKTPRLSYLQLFGRLPGMILIVLTSAAFLGIAGDLYLLNWISEDFRALAVTNMWRPRRFMTVYGIHLGGYLGGLLGIIYCVWSIRRIRRSNL